MNSFTASVWLTLIIVSIVFAPLVTIWSLNTLFGLSIAYTIESWFATVWLQATVLGTAVTAAKHRK
jgi:hypothetical protein